MMKKLAPNQWAEFQGHINRMPDNSSPREILNAILSWVRSYPEIFSGGPFSTYWFDRYLKLKDQQCPVDTSKMYGVEFLHFKKIIKKYDVKDVKNIARYLRDTLEALVVMEIDKQCPRCESWGMNVYKHFQSGKIAFECRQCGFSSYSDGSRVSANELTFANGGDLREAGLL